VALAYGTRTAFTNASNLHSLANNAAKPLGKVDNSTALDFAFLIELEFTAGGTNAEPKNLEIYVIVAASDTTTTYTDRIDPAGTSDIASSLRQADCIENIRVDTISIAYRSNFILDLGHPWPFWALVAKNMSGSSLAASGALAHYRPLKY
jgi:hypothetical protein